MKIMAERKEKAGQMNPPRLGSGHFLRRRPRFRGQRSIGLPRMLILHW